jgi:tripeptide aminopeptidase
VTTAAASRATRQERERLLADFIRLCEIESPSGREAEISETVSAELRGAGLDVERDAAGNLLARIEAPGERSVLLCAHLDTVPLDGAVEVVQEDGTLTNRHEAILGADNKAAVACLLGVVRRLSADGAPLGVELLFTTGEEQALKGAKAFDVGVLHSRLGFVFDHASPIGELIVAAPTYYRIEAGFRGTAAHAGIRPEEGRSAIVAAARFLAAVELGRLDDQTTANVGRIEGGTAANVVAERCRVELEARSLDHDRAEEVTGAIVDAAAEAASDADCDVETTVEELFRGYRLRRSAEPVEIASRALASVGIEPRCVTTGGGSDANALVAAGLQVLNVANGTERNHQPDESVTVEALETMLDVTLGVVREAAA